MTGRRNIGDPDRYAIVEHIQNLAHQDTGIQRNRFARLQINLAAGPRLERFQEIDQRFAIIIIAGDMMTAAKIDPFQRLEMRCDNRLDLCPGLRQRIKSLFAQIVEVNTGQMLEMLWPQLADREAESAVRLAGIIFCRFAQRNFRIDS